jgi:ribosomal protein S27E
MGQNREDRLVKRKQDLKGGFGRVRCPNLECSQIFYEKSQAYWNDATNRMICTQCEKEVVFRGTDFDSHSMDKITYIYHCVVCKEERSLEIPMERKYCSVCKTDHYTSWSYDLRAPLSPHDPFSSGLLPVSFKKIAA